MFRRPSNARDGHGRARGSDQEPVKAPAIGKLLTAMGSVTITRADVIVPEPAAGDPVHEGDLIETGIDGLVAIVFVDGTRFHLHANARAVLDEFIFDTEKSSNSALFRVVKGMFGFFAGKVATTGRLIIDTPLGQIRSTAPAAGIGSLAVTALTVFLIDQLKAASAIDVAGGVTDALLKSLLDDGALEYKDFPHGVYVIHWADGHDTVVDDPEFSVVASFINNTLTYQEVKNSSTDMALHQVAFANAYNTYSAGQQDPVIQQLQQHAQDTTPQNINTTFSSSFVFNPNTGQQGGTGPGQSNTTVHTVDLGAPKPLPPVTDTSGQIHPPAFITLDPKFNTFEVPLQTGLIVPATNLPFADTFNGILQLASDEATAAQVDLIKLAWASGINISTQNVDDVTLALIADEAKTALTATVPSNGSHQVQLNFGMPDEDFDFLAAGEKLTLTYNVTVSNVAGSTTELVTITITGTDDQPVINTPETVSTLPSPASGAGEAHASISADGNFFAYDGSGSAAGQVFFYDRTNGTPMPIDPSSSHANETFSNASISYDGRYVVFQGDYSDGGPQTEIFIYSYDTNKTTLLADPTTGDPIGGTNARISANGQFIAMEHVDASDGDHILVVDRNGTIVNDFAAASHASISDPAISADGKTIAFLSTASQINVLSGTQTNIASTGDAGALVLYTYDRTDSTIQLHAVATVETAAQLTAASGQPDSNIERAASLSLDGSRIAFATDVNPNDGTTPLGHTEVYLYDKNYATDGVGQKFTLVSAADGDSVDPQITADGNHVVFTSTANYLPNGAADGTSQTFIYNITTGATQLVPDAVVGSPENADFFAYEGSGSAAGQVFYYDRANGISTPIDPSSPQHAGEQFSGASTSSDGRFVVFQGDVGDVYVYDHDNTVDPTTLLADPTTGDPITGSNAKISADGQFIAMEHGVGQILVVERTGTVVDSNGTIVNSPTTAGGTIVNTLTATGGTISDPAISADGQTIAFLSSATSVSDGTATAAGDGHGTLELYVFNRVSDTITRISALETQGNSGAGDGNVAVPVSLSPDGTAIAFASNVDPTTGAALGHTEVYLYDLAKPSGHQFTLVSAQTGGAAADFNSLNPQFSADGKYVVFTSTADDLPNGTTDGSSQTYIYTVATGAI